MSARQLVRALATEVALAAEAAKGAALRTGGDGTVAYLSVFHQADADVLADPRFARLLAELTRGGAAARLVARRWAAGADLLLTPTRS